MCFKPWLKKHVLSHNPSSFTKNYFLWLWYTMVMCPYWSMTSLNLHLAWISPDQLSALSLKKSKDLKYEWKEPTKCDQQWRNYLRTCLHAVLKSTANLVMEAGRHAGKEQFRKHYKFSLYKCIIWEWMYIYQIYIVLIKLALNHILFINYRLVCRM